MSPLASNPPSRIICLRPFVIYENAMHRTAIVIKISSRFKFSVIMGLGRDGKAQQFSGLSLVTEILFWPLIGPDKLAVRLSFSVRDMTLWWSQLSRPNHIKVPYYQQPQQGQDQDQQHKSVMNGDGEVMMRVTPGPVWVMRVITWIMIPALTTELLATDSHQFLLPRPPPCLDQLAAHCLLKFLGLVCLGSGIMPWGPRSAKTGTGRKQIHKN